jgi:osmotically-inducible protein OsmY
MTMSMFKRFSALFLAALLASACAATPKQESTGEYIDDSWITTKVKTAILNEPSLKVAQINVETYKGVVQLSGFVDSAEAARKAAELARSVTGVTDVKNDTRVR